MIYIYHHDHVRNVYPRNIHIISLIDTMYRNKNGQFIRSLAGDGCMKHRNFKNVKGSKSDGPDLSKLEGPTSMFPKEFPSIPQERLIQHQRNGPKHDGCSEQRAFVAGSVDQIAAGSNLKSVCVFCVLYFFFLFLFFFFCVIFPSPFFLVVILLLLQFFSIFNSSPSSFILLLLFPSSSSSSSYIHTYKHTYKHTYIHTYIHTYKHTVHTYIHTYPYFVFRVGLERRFAITYLQWVHLISPKVSLLMSSVHFGVNYDVVFPDANLPYGILRAFFACYSM